MFSTTHDFVAVRESTPYSYFWMLALAALSEPFPCFWMPASPTLFMPSPCFWMLLSTIPWSVRGFSSWSHRPRLAATHHHRPFSSDFEMCLWVDQSNFDVELEAHEISLKYHVTSTILRDGVPFFADCCFYCSTAKLYLSAQDDFLCAYLFDSSNH